MKSDMIWTLVAFAFYLAGMLLIGAAYMKKTKSSEDFFLGGRGLNGWVAALSAQASDMSGWMLMGLPGAVYAVDLQLSISAPFRMRKQRQADP